MTSDRENPPEFSLVLGGPLYRLYLRCRLARPPIELLWRRIIAFFFVTWFPLAVLTLIERHALSGVAVPFYQDLGVHVRFLVSLPLLVGAEMFVYKRLRVVRQFVERGLILPRDRPRYDEAVATARRLENSAAGEVLLLILAFTGGFWLWRTYIAMDAVTWYAPSPDGSPFTIAGYWYAFVSLPLFRFLVLRWYFRLFIWYLFLWKVSRIPLHLNALHPDRAGGLGFLDTSPFAFSPVLLAQTVLLAGQIGDHIQYEGATLPQFQLEIAALIIFLVLLVYAPLLFFMMNLYYARRSGRREYGVLSAQYVTSFHNKWIKEPGVREGGEALLGTADIQSLADMGNSFSVVRETRLMPFSIHSPMQLGLLLLLPLFPLVLTMIPINEVINRLIKLAL